MVNVEILVILESLEIKGIKGILVNQENVVLKDHLAKMVLMETSIIAPSVIMSMH